MDIMARVMKGKAVSNPEQGAGESTEPVRTDGDPPARAVVIHGPEAVLRLAEALALPNGLERDRALAAVCKDISEASPPEVPAAATGPSPREEAETDSAISPAELLTDRDAEVRGLGGRSTPSPEPAQRLLGPALQVPSFAPLAADAVGRAEPAPLHRLGQRTPPPGEPSPRRHSTELSRPDASPAAAHPPDAGGRQASAQARLRGFVPPAHSESPWPGEAGTSPVSPAPSPSRARASESHPGVLHGPPASGPARAPWNDAVRSGSGSHGAGDEPAAFRAKPEPQPPRSYAGPLAIALVAAGLFGAWGLWPRPASDRAEARSERGSAAAPPAVPPGAMAPEARPPASPTSARGSEGPAASPQANLGLRAWGHSAPQHAHPPPGLLARARPAAGEGEQDPKAVAPGPDDAEWMRVNWGMDANAVLKALSPLAVPVRDGAATRRDRLTPAAAMVNATLGSHRYAVRFLFDRTDGLAAIELRVGPWDDKAFDEMVGWLSTKHGTPNELVGKPSEDGTRTAWWITRTGSIELREHRLDLADAHVLKLDFGSGRIEAMDGDLVVTYRRSGLPGAN